MGANTLEEFLSENMHRNYPLLDQVSARDTTGSYNIPTELIADMRIIVPVGMVAGGDFFVSQLIIRRYTADIEISYSGNNWSGVIGWFRNIDTESAMFREYELSPENPNIYEEGAVSGFTGIMVAGKVLSATVLPGSWTFDPQGTKLVPTAIEEQLTKFRALVVDESVLVGDIILKEGDNVTIEAHEHPDHPNTTVISISAREITPSVYTINNDDQLLDALAAEYGEPIVSINEMRPVNRNFYIKGADCINVLTNAGGAIIDNPCGKPCCSEEDYLAPVYDSVNQLNAKHAKLEDYMRSSVLNQNTLISRLKDMENSIGVGGI